MQELIFLVCCNVSCFKSKGIQNGVTKLLCGVQKIQELTYDYGYPLDSVIGSDGRVIEKPCHCGAATCRKRLY